jgi:hypothetical protein
MILIRLIMSYSRVIVIPCIISKEEYRAQFLNGIEPVVCVIMMKLKIRLETEEWVYEEHEMI